MVPVASAGRCVAGSELDASGMVVVGSSVAIVSVGALKRCACIQSAAGDEDTFTAQDGARKNLFASFR